jgi:anti-sigma B factor antagonist
MTEAAAFSIHSSTTGDVLVLSVQGEVDLGTAPALAQAIGLVPEPTSAVVVDLSGVTFLDSSGLNVLVSGQRALAEKGVELRVVTAPGGPVRRVFEITRLTGSLGVMDSLDDALARTRRSHDRDQ